MKRPVVLAQVGLGYWGRNLLRNFASMEGVDLRLACDNREEVLGAVRQSNPSLPLTARFADVLEDEAIEGVVIATETEHHYEMAARALEAGKHVFVEKPMAQTTTEAEHLVRLAGERDRHLMVGHLLLYHPAFEYVQKLVRNGDLGDIHYLYSTRVNLGIVRRHENAFESLAPHDLAVALALIDSTPKAVSAQGQAYLQPGIEDVVFATVYFENGAIAHLHTSWLDPHKARKVTVVGSRMMAVVDDVEPTEKVRLFDKGVDVQPSAPSYTDYAGAMQVRSGDIRVPHISAREPLRIECEHFAECIRTGERPRTDGESGLAVVRLLDAARKSLKTGGEATPL
jgi:predicted dehydrogenase